MTSAIVSKKGWVVIPQAYRRRYHLEPGTRVAFVDYGGVLAVIPVPEDPIRAGFGLLRDHGDDTRWTAALVAEHAAERAREDENP
jgi:bifunctional DNA-binding transcriptional regulator/antitoxin component of YhaV-PrlF toxin-antitoxin module